MSKIDIDKLGRSLVRSIAQELIAIGEIDPRGKSDEELHVEIINYLDTVVRKRNIIFGHILDHTLSIISEARKFARDEQYEMACLFYATWLEHWLNDMIATFCRRKKLPEDDITQIIRETQFRGKSTWLFRVLGLKPINETHLKRMQQVIESRNSFVHYKWKATDIDDESWIKDREKLIELLNNVEKTISYLRKFKNQQVYFGRKRKVLPNRKSKK